MSPRLRVVEEDGRRVLKRYPLGGWFWSRSENWPEVEYPFADDERILRGVRERGYLDVAGSYADWADDWGGGDHFDYPCVGAPYCLPAIYDECVGSGADVRRSPYYADMAWIGELRLARARIEHAYGELLAGHRERAERAAEREREWREERERENIAYRERVERKRRDDLEQERRWREARPTAPAGSGCGVSGVGGGDRPAGRRTGLWNWRG